MAKGLYDQSSLIQQLQYNHSHEVNIKLEDFSLLRNAEASLSKLVDIAAAVRHARSYSIDFKDAFCKDIGAYTLFAMLYRKVGNKRGRGGDITPAVNKVLQKLGIDKYAKMKLPKEDPYGVHPLPLEIHTARRTDKNRGLRETREDKVAMRVSKAINDWIAQCGFSFKEQGFLNLLTGLTEVFENGRHSSLNTIEGIRFGSWAVTGFMALRASEDTNESDPEYWCHLSIVTIGKTIAQAMRSISDNETRSGVWRYVDRHLGHGGLTEENLLTVAALQDGISSDLSADDAGGCGLGKMISIISMLGGEQRERRAPIITLISGNTCILMHEPYNNMVGQSGESSQFFNPENDKLSAPDAKYVTKMKVSLPGTIISIRFLIDQRFIQNAVKSA